LQQHLGFFQGNNHSVKVSIAPKHFNKNLSIIYLF